MASKYGYAAVYEVEHRSTVDYSKKLSKYTDNAIEAEISQSEREINTKTNNTFVGTRGFHECGLSLKTLATASGLTATTPYYFKINIDGGGVFEYVITTGTDVTYDAIILLMNQQISGAFFHLDSGDLRCSSITIGPASTIALTAGATGTDLFVTLTGFAAFDAAIDGSGSIPDAVQFVTIELSYRRMYNTMVWDGVMDRTNPKKRLQPLWEDTWDKLLEPFIKAESQERSLLVYT